MIMPRERGFSGRSGVCGGRDARRKVKVDTDLL